MHDDNFFDLVVLNQIEIFFPVLYAGLGCVFFLFFFFEKANNSILVI